MADLAIKEGDTEPIVDATLERDGSAYDLSTLSNPTVYFRMGFTDDPPLVDSQATIVNQSSGEIQYEWQSGDTDTVGNFKAEFVVEGDNTITTFPNDGYLSISILEEVQT